MRDDVVTDHTDLSASDHPAFAHHAASHQTNSRDGKDLPHLGSTQKLLSVRRRQQTFQCRANISNHLVNNAVEANFYTLALSQLCGFALGTDIEANNDAL